MTFSGWCTRNSFLSKRFLVAVAALFALLALDALGAKSARQSAPGPQQALQSTAELVKVDATVADTHGNFIAGLSQQDFRVLDNGLVQPLSFFAPVDTPARVLVMIETGPAVYLLQSEHLTAAYVLLGGLDPEDQVALVSYDEKPNQILPFARDKTALLRALGNIQYSIGMGELNFYDSLATVVDWLRPITGKRAIILLTTGLDSSPPSRWQALVQKLHQDDLVIFPVALGGPLRGYTGTNPKQAKDALKNKPTLPSAASQRGTVSFGAADLSLRALANITGGRAFFPESGGDFKEIYREVAAALRHQYVLGFEPAHDGLYHSLSVAIASGIGRTNKRKMTDYHVFAREGYIAPGAPSNPGIR